MSGDDFSRIVAAVLKDAELDSKHSVAEVCDAIGTNSDFSKDAIIPYAALIGNLERRHDYLFGGDEQDFRVFVEKLHKVFVLVVCDESFIFLPYVDIPFDFGL